MSEIQLMKMTKNQLFDLLSGHGKKVGNKKILKNDLVKLIIREGFNKPHDDDKSEGKDTGSSKDKGKNDEGKNLTAYDKKRIENAKKGIYMNPDRALSNGEPLAEMFRGLIRRYQP